MGESTPRLADPDDRAPHDTIYAAVEAAMDAAIKEPGALAVCQRAD
jgi:hypothetical protein